MDLDLPIEQLENLYAWVDELPLSRPKKNINRDFADGVLVAEIIHHYFPNVIDMHNYTQAFSIKNKELNWNVLNRKVLRKFFNFGLSNDLIQNLSESTPGVIERVLLDLRKRIDQKLRPEEQQQSYSSRKNLRSQRESDKPEADQNFGAQRNNKMRLKPKDSAPDVLAPPFEKITTANLSRADPPPRPSVQKQKQEMTKKDMTELYQKFREKEQELLAKEELIAVLQAKVRRLEHLVELKDTRIDEIQYQLEQLRPTAGHHRAK